MKFYQIFTLLMAIILLVACSVTESNDPYVDNCHQTQTFPAATYHTQTGDTVTVYFVSSTQAMTKEGNPIEGISGTCKE